MKKAWPSETCPAMPARRFRPRAAIEKMRARLTTRSQGASPRNRTNGIWSMTGMENGIRTRTMSSRPNATFLVRVGSNAASASYEV